MLAPYLFIEATQKFSTFSLRQDSSRRARPRLAVHNAVNCAYTKEIVKQCVERRPWVVGVTRRYLDLVEHGVEKDSALTTLQISDFENIRWELIMNRNQRASSYLVRKGLSRKAQLALQIRRYSAKRPRTILKECVPHTIILETWGAFDEMRVDSFGSGATFDVSDLPFRDRLEICLVDAKEMIEKRIKEEGWRWILKPSVTNKGADIAICESWDKVLDALEDMSDQREWVIQRYIEKPMLVLKAGHKFHLRVYILCVDALKVFVFEKILLLVAAHDYDDYDMDIYRHLTNTARSAEDISFEEAKFVQLLDDLPSICSSSSATKGGGEACNVGRIKAAIKDIVAELFAAFEAEYTVFAPMKGCFEVYGLDFMVTEDGAVSLLEVNPGPDFKQTGGRLKRVIEELWEQTFRICVDDDVGMAQDFSLVYDKVASVSGLGGMKMS